MKDNYTELGRAKQKQKTRDRILDSAQKFLSEGVDFTLEDVARDVSLSRATVYRYYSNIDILSREAGLALQTQSPEAIVASLRTLNTQGKVKGIQAYYNQLAVSNEAAFRKYLSVAVTASSDARQRGARRIKALRLALADSDMSLTEEETKKLVVVATALMGIEALIVTKDVCKLNDEQSLEALDWGLEMLMKGLQASKQP